MNSDTDILVTVGIPTYNRANSFLKEALESVLNQTYKYLEIIVSDNCSEDGTKDVVTGYRDKRIRYFRQDTNIGAIKNMNFCLEHASGTYFLMLHDDDLIDPHFIETCLKRIGYKKDKGIIIAGAREINVDGNVIVEKPNHCEGMSPYEFLLQWYNKRIVLFLCSILFHTATLKKIDGFKEYYRYFADVAAEFEIIGNTERVDVLDVLGSFRVNVDSFGKRAKIADWCDDSIKLLHLGYSLVEQHRTNGSRLLWAKGRKTSAEWMYRYATYRTGTHSDRAVAYLTVWKKFNFRYLPPKKYLYYWLPWLSYFLSPGSTALRVMKKFGQKLAILGTVSIPYIDL